MTNDEKLALLREIKGFDAEAGLRSIANMLPAYFRVLGLFVRNHERDKDLLNTQLKSGDIEAFDVTVHGYKSALANLGALILSQKAAELEKAAKNNDMAFIKNNLADFNAEMSDFAEKLNEVIN